MFMSATFPKAIIKYIKENMQIMEINLSDEYKNYRRVLFEYIEEDILEWIRKNLEFLKNKRVLIIVNLVDKARRIYELIKGNGYNAELLHSRFMVRDRMRKEKGIKDVDILISTQIAEVSLDISFDFLLTELSPIPSLIQRFGRVNRFGRKTDRINCYIFKPKEYDEMKSRYRHYPYDLYEMEVSENVIKILSEKLKNEYELLEVFNKIYTYESFMKNLKKGILKGYNIELLIKLWEEEYKYFFTALSENVSRREILDELFDLRGRTNVLCLLDPRMIDDEDYSTELNDLIDTWQKVSEFNEREKIFMKIKEFLIPIPIYLLKRNVQFQLGFPVIMHKSLRYSKDIGLYDISESEDIFL